MYSHFEHRLLLGLFLRPLIVTERHRLARLGMKVPNISEAQIGINAKRKALFLRRCGIYSASICPRRE